MAAENDAEAQVLESGGLDRFDYPLGFLFGISQTQHTATLIFSLDLAFFVATDAGRFARRYRKILEALLQAMEAGNTRAEAAHTRR